MAKARIGTVKKTSTGWPFVETVIRLEDKVYFTLWKAHKKSRKSKTAFINDVMEAGLKAMGINLVDDTEIQTIIAELD